MQRIDRLEIENLSLLGRLILTDNFEKFVIHFGHLISNKELEEIEETLSYGGFTKVHESLIIKAKEIAENYLNKKKIK